MKKLTSKLLGLALAIILAQGIIFFLPSSSYWSAMFDGYLYKTNMLNQIDGPRIIIISGSSGAYGIDSELIEAQTGLPVINMSLNAGLGLRVMLNDVKSKVRAGDLVVLATEYEHFFGTLRDGDHNLLWVIHKQPTKLIELSFPEQYYVLAKYGPSFSQERFKERLSLNRTSYDLSDFYNRNGDFVRHLDTNALTELQYKNRINRLPFNDEAIRDIHQFTNAVEQREGTVIYLFPPMAETQYNYLDNQQSVRKAYNELLAVSGLTVANTPKASVYSDERFFDTVYHLNGDGRRQHSEAVIPLIKGALSDGNGQN